MSNNCFVIGYFWLLELIIIFSSFQVYHDYQTYQGIKDLTWRVPHVEQELLTLPKHVSSPPVFNGIQVTWSLVFCVMFCRSLFALLSFFFCAVCPLIYCFWLPLSVSSNFSTDYKNWLVNVLILGSCLETWHLRLVSRHKPMSQVLYLWSYINNHKAKKLKTQPTEPVSLTSQ